jgi:ankyrin repeat protein
MKAILPENIFPSSPTVEDMTISPQKPSSVMKFLKLSMYLISNNFFSSTTDVSKKVYRWVKRRSNAGLMEYILSIGGPTVEALAENLFRVALDAEDVRTIKKMMKSGIDPNEQVYRDEWGNCSSPLNRACEMQSLKLVEALLKGGAKVGESVGKHDATAVLISAVNGRDDDYEFKEEYVDTELVKILLDAGAIVNPGLGESPLVSAVECGNVEVVNLLISAGADVNFIAGDENYSSTPLIKAIECEVDITDGAIISMVRTLLLAGADPQGGSIYEGEIETPLEAAMTRESIELIQLLLDHGARINEGSLARAVRKCDVEIVKLLLNSGGQVTESVIETAVETNSTITFSLLEATKDRMKSLCQTAALITSIEYGKMALIQELIAAGAQLSKSSKLKDAIVQVIKTGNMEVLNFLLDENSEFRTLSLESLDTGLQTAIRNSRDDIVELLLRTGANVNGESGGLDYSPLSEAIKRNDCRLAKQLLLAGAAVNETDKKGVTTSVLPFAVEWGYYPLIQDIISAGAEIDAPDCRDGRTALFIAIEKKSKEVIKLLIDAGANVNAPEAVLTGKTALLAASRNVDLQMARYLLELGADSDEGSLTVAVACSIELVHMLLEARLHQYKRYSRGYGGGALQHAIRLKDATMIKLLLGKGIDTSIILNKRVGDVVKMVYTSQPQKAPYIEPGHSALGFSIKSDKSKDSGIVRLLLHHGADPNSIVTNSRQTALLVGIDEGNLGLVKVLIAAGADVNPSLKLGVQRTPLQLAAERGRMDIVNVLLDNGADINAPPFERYGATALQFAAIGGYIGIAKLLIQRGADVNARSAIIGGRTALEGAAEHGRIDMLQLLLNVGALVIETGVKQYNRARELALENGHCAACRLLEKCSADILEIFNEWDQMFMDFGSFGEELAV